MNWQDIVEHENVIEYFRRAARSGRLASAYLFVGPPGVGKRTMAGRLAQALLCETQPDSSLEPCGHCSGCVQVAAQTHPDLELVSLLPGKTMLSIDQFAGDDEHRMREGLCYRLSLRPTRGHRKVAIIDDADRLSIEGANCLLKTLEEPPPGAVIILIGTSEHRQLPTIRSRCQVVRFQPLSRAAVSRLLLEGGHAGDPKQADELAALAQGSLQRAIELADPELLEFRRQLLTALADPGLDGVELAKTVVGFVESAGSDAPARRARLRQLIDFAVDLYRLWLRRVTGTKADGDDILATAAQRGAENSGVDSEMLTRCLERCLDAHQHVDANANINTLVDCWIDDLTQLMRGQPTGRS